MMKKLITTLIIIILVIFGFLAYMGMFSNVEVFEKEIGPYTFVYEEYVGDYADSGPIFNDIYETLKENGIETTKGMGIYYDDPETVLKEDLESKLGVIVTDEEAFQVDGRGLKYKIMTVDAFEGITAEFPLKNIISIAIGIKKAYPAISEYMEENGYKTGPAYEIYDYDEGKIIYAFPKIK